MAENRQPILKATLSAPAAAPLAITVASMLDAMPLDGLSALEAFPTMVLLFFIFGLPISYAAMLVLGLPYVLWLRSRDLLTWVPVYAGSALLGSIVWAGYWQMSLRPPSLLKTLPIGAAIGLLVGVVFCWVARCGPNNSFKPKPLRGSA